jgi:hypothetical protein
VQQKVQSSGHPPVLAEMMDSTSTAGPIQRSADLVGEPDQLGQLVVAGEDEPLGEVATDVASLLDEEVGGGFNGGG